MSGALAGRTDKHYIALSTPPKELQTTEAKAERRNRVTEPPRPRALAAEKAPERREKPAQEAPAGNLRYTVNEDGVSLSILAFVAYGDRMRWKEIADANRLSNPDLIHLGQEIEIPFPSGKRPSHERLEKLKASVLTVWRAERGADYFAKRAAPGKRGPASE